jgi:hypothetical protein
MVQHKRSDAKAIERVAVIREMVSSLVAGENRQFYVGLVGYYIDGIPYSASGLSVDANRTPDIQATDAAFTCTAMFEPRFLEPSTVQRNGTVQVTVDGAVKEIVQVRMEVMLHDIWCLAEFVDGVQHDLFLDPDTLSSRLRHFKTPRI